MSEDGGVTFKMYRRKLSCFDWWKSDPRLLQVPSKEDKSNKRMIKKFKTKSNAPAENRTRGPTMATLDFTTKPLALAEDKPNIWLLLVFHSFSSREKSVVVEHRHRHTTNNNSTHSQPLPFTSFRDGVPDENYC
eukprot:scaffold3068_cov77-Skeletonema_dohrnii-CCMP3373.AAC.3